MLLDLSEVTPQTLYAQCLGTLQERHDGRDPHPVLSLCALHTLVLYKGTRLFGNLLPPPVNGEKPLLDFSADGFPNNLDQKVARGVHDGVFLLPLVKVREEVLGREKVRDRNMK